MEVDQTAKVDHVNFIKGILSTLQVYSPVVTDDEQIVSFEREIPILKISNTCLILGT